MNDKPSAYNDDEDDFDEEAEARERYGDLILATEDGSTYEPRPTNPESANPTSTDTSSDQSETEDDPDDPLRFESYGNLFSARPINSYLQTASEGPPQRPLFGPFWHEGELAILFADTGIGKSLLSVQIGESIASGISIPPFESDERARRVLLVDFEMNEQQIMTRYSSEDGAHQFQFSDDLIRIVIGHDTEKPHGYRQFTDYIAASILEHVEHYEAKIVIIDNITWLTASTRSTADAARMMKILNHLKLSNRLSMLVLAHTPKRYGASPLSLNDLYGSKMLANFADSIFAMGSSRKDPNTRYLKQLKSRQHERKYDETNTFTMHLAKMPGIKSSPPYEGGVAAALGGRGGSLPATETTETTETKETSGQIPADHRPLATDHAFLGFTHTGTNPERDHIGWHGSHSDPSRIEKLYKAHVLHAEGKTQRQIAQTLGLSLTTINRYISQSRSYQDPEP